MQINTIKNKYILKDISITYILSFEIYFALLYK